MELQDEQTVINGRLCTDFAAAASRNNNTYQELLWSFTGMIHYCSRGIDVKHNLGTLQKRSPHIFVIFVTLFSYRS